MLFRSGKVSYVEEATILYRQHGHNDVGAQNSNSVFYLLKRMLQGDDIKRSLLNTRKQAEYFAKIYQEKEDSLIYRYAKLAENGKLKRLLFYKTNDVKKSTLPKNIGLLLWG